MPQRPTVQRQALQVQHRDRGQGIPGYAHLLPAQKGWEQIADDALAWAVAHAVTGVPQIRTSSDGSDK